MRMRHAHRWRIAGAAVVAGLLCAACGSSSSSPGAGVSPSHSPAPAASPLCEDAAALRASVEKLSHVRIGKGTADEIKSDLADVKTQLDTLITDAHGQMQAQTSGVKTALNKVETAVSDLTAHPSASTISGVVSALSGLSAAVGTLLTALDPHCPSLSSASPSA